MTGDSIRSRTAAFGMRIDRPRWIARSVPVSDGFVCLVFRPMRSSFAVSATVSRSFFLCAVVRASYCTLPRTPHRPPHRMIGHHRETRSRRYAPSRLVAAVRERPARLRAARPRSRSSRAERRAGTRGRGSRHSARTEPRSRQQQKKRFVAQCESILIERLAGAPYKFKGKKVDLHGLVGPPLEDARAFNLDSTNVGESSS